MNNNPIYIYPGTYGPPTKGHQAKIMKTVGFLPEAIIICSVNPTKKDLLFTPQECKEMWKSYDLPANTRAQTLNEFLSYCNKEKIDFSRVIIVRGIRGDADYEDEKKVIEINRKIYGIDKYMYVYSDEQFKNISSSKAIKIAEGLEFEKICDYVSPIVTTRLFEKILKIKNLYMVVGKPAGGKSTFLKKLTARSGNNIHINTDDFNKIINPLLKEHFGDQDLISIAINDRDQMRRVAEKPWFDLLRERLKTVPENSNVFLEIPYGMQDDKQMYSFVGGKVLYIGCENDDINKQRLIDKGKKDIIPFVDVIPNRTETEKIAEQNKLDLYCVDTNCTLDELGNEVLKFNIYLNSQ